MLSSFEDSKTVLLALLPKKSQQALPNYAKPSKSGLQRSKAVEKRWQLRSKRNPGKVRLQQWLKLPQLWQEYATAAHSATIS